MEKQQKDQQSESTQQQRDEGIFTMMLRMMDGVEKKLQAFDIYARAAKGFIGESMFCAAERDIDFMRRLLEGLSESEPSVILAKVLFSKTKGMLASKKGQLKEARGFFEEALRINKALGNHQGFEQDAEKAGACIVKHLEGIGVELEVSSVRVVRSSSSSTKLLDVAECLTFEVPQTSMQASTSSKAVKKKMEALKRGPKTDKLKPWVCSFKGCDSAFTQKSHLTRHINSMHNDSSIKCERGCGSVFKSRDSMLVHVKSVHDGLKFSCKQCDRVFASAGGLYDHMGLVHKGASFECCTCRKRFPRYRYLRIHQSTQHFGEQNYKCHLCEKAFSSSSSLKSHILGYHKKEQRFNCDACSKRFIYCKTFKKHQRSRLCKVCGDSFNCSRQFFQHKASHTFVCELCERTDVSRGKACAHGNNSHVKRFECPQDGCSSKFTTKSSSFKHMANVHGLSKCLICSEHFGSVAVMMKHCSESHPQFECLLCTDSNAKFFYFKVQELSYHIIEKHHDIHHCNACGQTFNCIDAIKLHECSRRFSKRDLDMFVSTHQTVDLSALGDENLASVFTDENGLIEKPIPGFPFQATCSIDKARNTTLKLKFDKFKPVYLNQSQHLIQNGTTAILTWCTELNALSSCIEYIKWKRTEDGGLMPKPRFDRRHVDFRRDENDSLFNARSLVLEAPYHRGHARPAGDCFNEIDFLSSFSSLNMWPMHERLNSVYWRILEDHIRRISMREDIDCTYVTTGAIFVKGGKVLGSYIKGLLVPPAFFKIALFQKIGDGKLQVCSWIMRNDDSEQSVASSEVSILLIEKLSKTRFFTAETLARVDEDSIKRHCKELRQQDGYLEGR